MEDEFIFFINKVEEFSQSFFKNFKSFLLPLVVLEHIPGSGEAAQRVI